MEVEDGITVVEERLLGHCPRIGCHLGEGGAGDDAECVAGRGRRANPEAKGMLGTPEIVLILVGLAGLALWIWALLDCALHEPPTIDKLVWIFIIGWLNILGALAYLMLRRPRRGASPRSP